MNVTYFRPDNTEGYDEHYEIRIQVDELGGSDMREEFVKCKSYKTAKRRCPWAAVIMRVEGGYHAYESVEDYRTAKRQK